MTDAGLRVRSDGMGNIFGRWEGTHPAERAFQAGRCHLSLPLLTLIPYASTQDSSVWPLRDSAHKSRQPK